MRNLKLLTVGVLFVSAPFARAQDKMLDLIPSNAAAGLAIRNLDELKAKGDKFIAEAELRLPLRPSDLFAMGFQFLGVNGGIDTKNTAAVVIAGPEKDQNIDLPNLEKLIVVALPFTDLDQLAANFGFKKGELTANKMAQRDRANFGLFFFVRGKHLFLGNGEKAVAQVARGQSLSQELSVAQRKSLNNADIVLHLGTKTWGREWQGFLQMLKANLGKREDAGEQKVLDQFIDSIEHMRFGVAAVRIDGGLGLSFLTVFAKEGNDAGRKFLATLGGGPGASDLKGLPEGNVVAAQAARGDGSKNAVIAKVFFDFLLQHFLETKQVLATVDRPVVVGFLTEVWNRLQGSRAGLYLNADESRLGLFNLLAILDTDDAEKFVATMRILARIADATGIDLDNKEEIKNGIDVNKLIKDLGDPKYRVRESATLKLRLLGEAALPYLDKARAAPPDLEVAQRVQKLRTQIAAVAASRRKELLSQDVLRHVRPTFAFVPKAEQRAGYRVDVVRIKLSDQDKHAVRSLRQLLGPEWNNLRLAVHGKQVVVLLGSDVKLLEVALKNLKEGAPGLAASKTLQPFTRASNPARKIEFHLSMEKALALINSDLPDGRSQSLTSFALTVDQDLLQLDVWVPSPEVKVIARKNRWF